MPGLPDTGLRLCLGQVSTLLRASEHIISGASILQLWQPAQVGTAAEGAAATLQTSLPALQPP